MTERKHRILKKLDKWLFSPNPLKVFGTLLVVPFGVCFFAAIGVVWIIQRWFS